MKKELFSEECSEEFIYPLFANALEEDGLLGYYKEYKYESDSITVTARGNVGHATVRNERFNAVGRLIILTSKKDLNMNFFEEYINNNVKVHIESTGVPQLTAPSLKINKLHYPSLLEQNQIANFLGVLNKKMELLEKKHESYVSFKKYLMQQIFTQKLRFNFNDDWKHVNLIDICEIGKGFTPSTSKSEFWDGNIDWLSIADMNQGKYINYSTKKITEEGTQNKEIIKRGTLLMSFKLTIGKLGILNKDMYTNEAICNFKLKNDKVLTEYLYYYLNSINIMKYGSQAAKGITLNNDTLSTIPILLPSISEQKKIVEVLSIIDKKIDQMSIELEICIKFKKGLLQQMFV